MSSPVRTSWRSDLDIGANLLNIFALITVSASLPIWAGCQGSSSDNQQPLVLIVSADTAGWITPCGCTANQSGGLPRRGDFLAKQRADSAVIYVDTGGAPSGASPYDRTKFEAILSGERAMNIAAHNIGRGEAELGGPYLREISRTHGVPFVSCNVRDQEGQVAEPVRIVETAGRRVALVGVLSESYSAPTIEIDPPRDAILNAIRPLQEEFDILVVLAYLPTQELEELASGLPESHVIVGGPTGQSIVPRRIGPVWLGSATNKGKFIVRFRIPPNGLSERWQGDVVELNESYQDDIEQTENIERYYKALALCDYTPQQTPFVQSISTEAPETFRVAGSSECRECHPRDCTAWRESKHAHAWLSLTASGAEVDPYCQQCHTTGYGLPGGFHSAGQSKHLTSVGCESCHGPSRAHVENPKTHTAYFGQASGRCVGCHDRENSPDFAYDTYWPKILHGQQSVSQGN